jgi:hypothetical protein
MELGGFALNQAWIDCFHYNFACMTKHLEKYGRLINILSRKLKLQKLFQWSDPFQTAIFPQPLHQIA